MLLNNLTCEIFTSVSDRIVEKAHNRIKCPSGAVCPCAHSEPSVQDDVNRTGNVTQKVQMTCAAITKITSVVAQWPGNVRDFD